MKRNLHVRAVGLIAALVLGVGGSLALHGPARAADPNSLGLDLSGLTNVTTTIGNTTGAVTGTVDATLGTTNSTDGATSVGANASAGSKATTGLLGTGLDNTVDGLLNTAGGVANSTSAVDGGATNSLIGKVDSVTDVVTGEADGTGASGSGNPVNGVLDGLTGVLGGGSNGGVGLGTGDLDNTVDGVLNTLGGVTNSTSAADGGAGNSLIEKVDGATDLVTGEADGNSDSGSGSLVSGVLDGLGNGSTGSASDSLAGLVHDLASIPTGERSTVGSTTDQTADGVTNAVNPVAGQLLDSCINVPPAGVSIDLGSSCGGGSGILDPITTAVGPITNPILNACLTAAGVDAQSGTTCTGSGNGGNGDLLGPVTGVLDQGTGVLNPVLGNLSLPPVDTSPATGSVNQVINPLDVCANVNPVNISEELGAGCSQPEAPCTLLNINCLLADLTDPILGPGGALDPVLDTCLGYDPIGFNLDIGSACAATTPPPSNCPPDCGTTCPPDCGTTCPPDCGPPVCTLICGPIFPACPPDCGATCPPACNGNPGDNGAGAVAGNLAGDGSLVAYMPSGTHGAGTLVINATAASALPSPAANTSGARPQSAQFDVRAAAFTPPLAGDGGLLDRGWGDAAQPIDPALLFITLFVVGCCLRRRQRAERQ